MVIGNWKTSTILGLVALTFWGTALGWYFIGNHRIELWWGRMRLRLGLKPPEE